MAKREDSSAYLYHWTKSNIAIGNKNQWYEEAYRSLFMILSSFELRSGASQGMLCGHDCICFTGSPLSFIANDTSKYQPFGLEFWKSNIYLLGGAFVIYCTKSDYELLPHELRWRWMNHDPLLRDSRRPYGIDFSWEREVRVNAEKIILLGKSTIIEASSLGNIELAFRSIILPDTNYEERLLYELDKYFAAKAHHDACNDRHYDWLCEFFNDVIEEYRNRIIIVKPCS
ncbi:hypothetical protein Q4R49_19380 [Morganella morganii subsp. sibonii]